jgi:hypothetical protein
MDCIVLTVDLDTSYLFAAPRWAIVFCSVRFRVWEGTWLQLRQITSSHRSPRVDEAEWNVAAEPVVNKFTL